MLQVQYFVAIECFCCLIYQGIYYTVSYESAAVLSVYHTIKICFLLLFKY